MTGLPRLTIGAKPLVLGTVPLCPVHTDDYPTTPAEGLSRILQIKEQRFEVLEVRPKADNGVPWYRVRLPDGTEGWINSIALIEKVIL